MIGVIYVVSLSKFSYDFHRVFWVCRADFLRFMVTVADTQRNSRSVIKCKEA